MTRTRIPAIAAALGVSNVDEARVEIFKIDDETHEMTIETVTGAQARVEI